MQTFLLPVWQRVDGDVGGRDSILGSELSSVFALPPFSLLTPTRNRAIRNVPVPPCPLKHLQMYSASICNSWKCGGVSSCVSTRTDDNAAPLRGVSAAPEVTLLPYYSFISSTWRIMMLLPYSVCWGSPRSRINCSFSHRPVIYNDAFNTSHEFPEQNYPF